MISKIENALLALAGVCVVVLGVMITFTVFSRSVLGWGVPDDVVIVKELMVGAILLPLAAVSAARIHIAIEFVFNRFGPGVQVWLTAFASLFALLAVLPIGYAAWNELAHVVSSGAWYFGELSLPKWPGRLAFFVGMGFFALRLLLLFVEDLRIALSGKKPAAAPTATPYE